MPILTQNRFPSLWLLMQYTIGGNVCKQALATEYYNGQKRVLEIGRPTDGWFFRWFYAHFEQGIFLRSRNDLQRLVERSGIILESIEDRMVSPGVVKRPYVARFNLLVGTPVSKSTNAFTE